jgi:hypothetical protein
MLNWRSTVFIMFVLVIAGALYIRLRWRRAPQAYRAMYFLFLHFPTPIISHFWRSDFQNAQ